MLMSCCVLLTVGNASNKSSEYHENKNFAFNIHFKKTVPFMRWCR